MAIVDAKKHARILHGVTPESTREGRARQRRYWLALGRFADMFARIEAAVTYTLWHYANTPLAISKIILVDRVDSSITKIKQLAKASEAGKDKYDDLDSVLQQLGIINGVRNSILHYGAEAVAEGNAFVTDALRAKGEPTKFPISPTSLN